MVRTHLVVLATSLGLLCPAPAGAGPLTSASLEIPFHFVFTFPGAGATGTAASNKSVTVGSGSPFHGFSLQYASASGSLQYEAVKIGSNGAGLLTGPIPNQVRGPLPVTGTAYVGFGGVLVLPFVLGAPASRFDTRFTRNGGVGLGLTARGASWTAGTAKLTRSGITRTTITGANLLTPGGGGTLVLVSPNRIFTTLSASPFIPLPSFLTLTFAPVPEPGTLGLLGLGVLVLAVLGWRRAWA